MFKLIKILNGRSNVPDIVTLQNKTDTVFKANHLYFYSYNTLTISQSYNNDKFFIVTKNYDKATKTVEGYFITQDMVFEAPATIDPGKETSGINFTLMNIDSDCHVRGVEADSVEPGVGQVIDISDYFTKGTVLVQFNCVPHM